ncbi:GntR family transcriptional regulator [Lactobacillus ultunensis]|uniref:UbiC transcription regulator-associated domain protein n=1 Tax=Lactobacillus ultunensis DSM 16047 TaxID=525365 RepID=C2EQM3_9LACO|nr:GntR family transcriptional regulator [Lactobacillus ultunensis]EEJ71161.1 UbiC transcription regulator-associated domain protein [Lactobacillus ultunensis DSM 16047]KRL80067.1 transcriptional regulator [Lactobacillus ultunensis DSM 16047]QQP28793.1 GntR family transcriptional regulator [Lactobacillus ultunensis]
MTKAKYVEVAEEIEEKIKKGQYKRQTALPDQETLAKEYNVSRLTIQKALDGLDRKGIVYKQSGMGTFVLGDIPFKDKRDAAVNAFIGLGNQLGKNNVSSKVLHYSVEFPDDKTQEYLNIDQTEPVYDIVRLRIYEEEPLMIEHTYMPVKLVPGLTKDVLHASVYDYMHKKLNLKFGHAYRRIRAVKANKYDEKYLNAKKDDPMLELEQVVWLINGVPVEYSTSRNRYDTRYYVTVDNNRF